MERVFEVPQGALVVGCVAAALNVSATVVPLALLRAQERLRAYLAVTWLQMASLSVSRSFSSRYSAGVSMAGWRPAP